MKIDWVTMAISILVIFVIVILLYRDPSNNNAALSLTLGFAAAGFIYFYKNRLGWKENAISAAIMGVLLLILYLAIVIIVSGVPESKEIEILIMLFLASEAALIMFGQLARWVFERHFKEKK